MNSLLRIISGFVFGAAMLFAITAGGAAPAYALDNGIYVATATSYYAHPYTGVIEDSGGESSAVLGQSMTESALHTQALIEVDPNGNMFATVRLYLMDNIENPQFMVQDDPYGSFYDVSADVMMENYDNNTTDFRFQIPHESCVVRSTFYVVPMGRDVIFYIDFADLTEGSGDFITSVEMIVPEVTETSVDETVEEIVTEEATEVITATEITTTTTVAATTTTVQTTVTTEAVTTAVKTEQSAEAAGIVMFDENGIEIKELSQIKNETSNNNDSSSPLPAIFITGAAGILIGGGAVFFINRKKGSK